MNRIVGLTAALALVVPLAACTSSESPVPVEGQAISVSPTTKAGPGADASTSTGSETVVSNDLPQGENLLFALQAASGTLQGIEDDSAFTLTLSDTSDQTTWFSDRPMRDGGTITTETLISKWAALGFVEDPPNAVLSIAGRESQPGIIMELMTPMLVAADDRLTFDIRVIGREGVSDLPETFEEASLFIDDASMQNSCSFTGEIDYFAFSKEIADYVPADGRAMSITQAPELFGVLGNRFGGDANSFAVPSVPDLAPGVKARICVRGADPSNNGPDDEIDTTCSVGKVQLFAQEQPVYGYALANGQELPISSRLFAYAGTAFGGDGVNTFATPSIPAPPGMSQQVCASGYYTWSVNTQDSAPMLMAEVSYWATANGTAPAPWYGEGTRGIRGGALSIPTNAALYALLGNTFGGDEHAIFYLPKVQSSVPGLSVKIALKGYYPDAG